MSGRTERLAWRARLAEALGLSEEQRLAAFADARNVLVSAGAGVGKTEVLAARAVSLLADPVAPLPADRLLVVTFTEAAALGMRRRIETLLEKALLAGLVEESLAREQGLRLARALVGTIHSFCLWVLRRHYDLLGLDPSFRVLDEGEAGALAFRCCREVVEAEPAAAATVAFALGTGADGGGLVRVLLDLHRFLEAVPYPDRWLAGAGAPFARASAEASAARAGLGDGDGDGRDLARGLPWWRPLGRQVAARLGQAADWLELAALLARLPGGPAAYADTLERERAALLALGEAAGRGGGEWLDDLAGFRWAPLPTVRQGEADDEVKKLVAELRGRARRLLEAVVGRLPVDAAAVLEEARACGEVEGALIHLLSSFRSRYGEAKARLGALDFADLEHKALACLADERAASAVRERLGAVLVDEYQDVNPVQQEILDRVGTAAGLFLVGDARQSIYGFRHADPDGFCRRHRAWSGARDSRVVPLAGNRRSRPGVVAAVNFIFRQLDGEAVEAGAWPAGPELEARAPFPPPDPAVELHLVERGPAGDGEDVEPDGDPDAQEREALVVAARIRALVEGGGGLEPVRLWDLQERCERPLRYADVAVLLRALRGRERLVEALRRAGIPVQGAPGGGALDSPEVKTVLALLEVLDNPRQDAPLAAVLLSPLAGLTVEDLARVRAAFPGRGPGDLGEALRRAVSGQVLTGAARDRAGRFLAILARWRRAARSGPLGQLLDLVYGEAGFLDRVTAWPGGAQRRANLLALRELARRWDASGSGGPGDFARFVREAGEHVLGGGAVAGGDGAAAGGGEVRVLSIHAAKGLEFPVVVLADLGRPFDDRDARADVLANRRWGLGFRLADEEAGLRVPTLGHSVLAEERRRSLVAEEMRLLYVALTRARERLILVGSARDLPRQCRRWAAAVLARCWPLGPGWVWNASSYLDWIAPAVARHPDGRPLREAAGWAAGIEPRGEAAGDASRWEVRLWPAVSAGGAGAAAGLPWDEAASLWEAAELDAEAAALAAVLGARCDWRYPWQGAAERPAKLSVSRLAAAAGTAGPRGEASVPEVLVPETDDGPARAWTARARPSLRRPGFALEGRAGLTASERGEAVHRVLQRLDLRRPLDEADVEAQVAELAGAGFLTPEEAGAVDRAALAAFFRGPVGSLLRERAGAVRREVSFYLTLPAGEVYPELAGSPAGEDRVLVQGVIDALLVESDGLVLVEFKTGSPGEEELTRYRAQVRLYARAARELYGRPVRVAWLCLLDADRVLEVEVSA